jgi:hypothetical protein
MVQFVVPSYLTGFALTQIVAGFLANRKRSLNHVLFTVL